MAWGSTAPSAAYTAGRSRQSRGRLGGSIGRLTVAAKDTKRMRTSGVLCLVAFYVPVGVLRGLPDMYFLTPGGKTLLNLITCHLGISQFINLVLYF